MNFKSVCMGLVTMGMLSGCTMARIYSTSGNDVSLTDNANKSGEAFKIEKRITFDYTGAIDVQEVLRERFGSGHEFENVSVKLKADVPDFFLNLITIGIAQSKTFEISGDKIK